MIDSNGVNCIVRVALCLRAKGLTEPVPGGVL